jgi:4-hydroxymandelate oxidase
VHPDGELATVRAAGAAGTIMVLSTLSTCAVEDVVAAARGPVWFQLYVYRDRAATEALVRRAEAAGCQALVLTVDAPVLGRRERDVRNQFHLPPGIEAVNLLAAGYQRVEQVAGASGLSAYVGTLIEPAIAWSDLEWLQRTTRLPVLVKGVVRADDAARAVAHGAAGVIVSNHGGRQLDSSPATAEVLARVVDAVAGRAEVLVDGGVRRGTDVVKALALGARAVLLGRPILWGLSVGGEAGARRALELLRVELDEALALCGCRRPGDATRDLLDGGTA